MEKITTNKPYEIYVERDPKWDFQLDYLLMIIERIHTIKRAATELFEFVCFHNTITDASNQMSVKFVKSEDDNITVSVGLISNSFTLLKLEDKK